MKKLLTSLAVAATLVASSNVFAEDVADLTCSGFSASNEIDQGSLAYWLLGYYNGLEDIKAFPDPDTIKNFYIGVATFCQQNPDAKFIEVPKLISGQ